MLNFFKLSLLSACLVNTVAFASGHPNHQEAEETTFISAPLQLSHRNLKCPFSRSAHIYLIDDASTKERNAWSAHMLAKTELQPVYFREPVAKILKKDGMHIAIVYQVYANEGPSDRTRVDRDVVSSLTFELRYHGKLGVNLDEWYPVNEPGRVGWAKRTANEVKALANLRWFINPSTKG